MGRYVVDQIIANGFRRTIGNQRLGAMPMTMRQVIAQGVARNIAGLGAHQSAMMRLNTLDRSDFTPEAIAQRAAITASLPDPSTIIPNDTIAVEASTASVAPDGTMVPGPNASVVQTPTTQDASSPVAVDTGASTSGGIGLGTLAVGALILGWLAFKK